jgi:hypothetical protein
MTVQEEGRRLNGAVLFYEMRLQPGGAPKSSTPGVPEPMIDPGFDGKTLTFKVSHRYAHPPRTLHDPPVSFRLELTGANKGKLVAPEGLSVEMVRDTY